MTNQEQGARLNQLSRLLFDKAADGWCLAIAVEIIAGFFSPIISLFSLSIALATFCSFMGLFFLVIVWVLKFNFNNTYENAETMRRQSVFTEALDWPIGDVQFSHWVDKADKKTIDSLRSGTREAGYYATVKQQGAGKLLDMASESAFWTRHLYSRIERWLRYILIVGCCLVLTVMFSIPFPFASQDIRLKIVNFVYLFLPVILSIDVLGWWLKVRGAGQAIKEIEQNFEGLRKGEISLPEVIRLVSEYNCQLVSGMPIPNWFFKIYRNEITERWKMNAKPVPKN